jgi:hypothetical protein
MISSYPINPTFARLLRVHGLPRHPQAVKVPAIQGVESRHRPRVNCYAFSLPNTVSAPKHTITLGSSVLSDGRSRQPLVDDGILLQLGAKVIPDLLPAHNLTSIRVCNGLKHHTPSAMYLRQLPTNLRLT